MRFTSGYSKQICKLKEVIKFADAIIVGAGFGLSMSGGLTYTGERFQNNFAEFIKKYKFRDMYSATFYHYNSLNEYWAYMSRHVDINRYSAPVGMVYNNLLELVKDKDYFVLTTNVDHQFQKAGFDKSRLFYTQGDYGLFQCSVPCHKETYDNVETISKMVKKQKDLLVSSELIPYCPKCGKPMSMNLRCDNTFVENKGWHLAEKQYYNFVDNNAYTNILYLELGVGFNTPVIIKYPFWLMVAKNPKSVYACVNIGDVFSPSEIEKQSIGINDDINKVITSLIE